MSNDTTHQVHHHARRVGSGSAARSAGDTRRSRTRVEELQLPARIKRLQALDTRALRSGMPDKLVGNGHAGECLPFSEHVLEVDKVSVLLLKNIVFILNHYSISSL